MIYQAITLYQPWATWIMREWKTIETRTHNRFSSLLGRTILIHAGKHTDNGPAAVNNPYLTKPDLLYKPEEMINGFILGSAFVKDFGLLHDREHSESSLIDCENEIRWGLRLTDIKKFENPIPVAGSMGIWYFDMEKMEKVKVTKKPVTVADVRPVDNQGKLFYDV